MDLFLFVFMCVAFEFCDTEEVWTCCLSWALQRTLGSQRQPTGTDAGAYENKKATQVGKEYIMKGEKSLKPILEGCPAVLNIPENHCKALLLRALLIHFQEGSNHPFHFILTTSKFRLPDCLHDYFFHLPKNQMPINYTKVKLAW